MYDDDKIIKELLRNEQKIEAREFAGQLLPLFREFFAGDFSVDGSHLFCSFLNGDKFKITVFSV